MWRTLVTGAKLVIGKPDAWLDPAWIVSVLEECKVVSLWGVPSPFALVMDECNDVLPTSFVDLHLSGEALPARLVHRIMSTCLCQVLQM